MVVAAQRLLIFQCGRELSVSTIANGPRRSPLTPDPESAAIKQDEKRTLDRLMSALPEEHREV